MDMRLRWVPGLLALPLMAAVPAQAEPLAACGAPATRIGTIQGSGSATQLIDARVEVEAVVVADFHAGLGGFFLQDADADRDGDPNTSDGVFVSSDVAVELGQRVRLAARVTEADGLTELTDASAIRSCPGERSASAVPLRFPLATRDELERYEGMRVEVTQTLTVTGNYTRARYGALELSANGRLFQPSELAQPGAPANSLQTQNQLQRILLDDGSGAFEPTPPPYLDALGTRRSGDTITGVSAILDQRFGDYRLQPTAAVTWTPRNPRPALPRVPGRLRVASANLHNYFVTLHSGDAGCGSSGTLECRGARTAAELTRQRAKLVAELSAIDADVVGLLELQNDASSSVADLVAGLNDASAASTYAYVDTGTIGSDAIKVALLYQPAKVSSVGDYALLDSSVDPRFDDTSHRPVLAQTFSELASGARFTVVVNHWKSKSGGCHGDPDTGDGQGPCNRARVAAAEAVALWLGAVDDSGLLLIGDFNAYAEEDPVKMLEGAGYHRLAPAHAADAYSFQYDAQFGSLDHAFASPALAPSVRGFAVWHINADEPPSAADDVNAGPARASDHDPLIIGLDLRAPTMCAAAAARRL
jgi:predicted extracellular nuclease